MTNTSFLQRRNKEARGRGTIKLVRGLIENGGELEAETAVQLGKPWGYIARMICSTGYKESKAGRLDAFERAIAALENGKEIYEIVYPEPPDLRALPGLVSADELRSAQYEPQAWAIPRLLPAGLAMLAGQAKVGKSWLALQMAQAVATGKPLFDKKARQGRVLYMALEDTPERIKRRTKKQGWTDGLEVYFYSAKDFGRYLQGLDGTGGMLLGREMARGRYRLVVIDTLSRAFSGGENLTAMMEKLAPLHAKANELNCAVLLVDHHRKQRRFDENAIEDIHGSIAKSGVADTVLGLYRKGDGAWLQVKGRDVVERRIRLRFEEKRGIWGYDDGATA